MRSWKQIVASVGLLGLSTVAAVPVFAASAPAHPHPARRVGPWFGRRLVGTVSAVNGSTITIRTKKGRTFTIDLTTKATVAENGQKVTETSITTGEDALFLRVHKHKGVLVSPAVIVGSTPIAMPAHVVYRHLGQVSTTGSTMALANKKGPIATFTPTSTGGSLVISPTGKPSRTVVIFRTIVHVGNGQTALSDVTAGDFATLVIHPTRLGARDVLVFAKHPLGYRPHPKKAKTATAAPA